MSNIIRIERDSAKPTMWRCKTSDNASINVFDNQLSHFWGYPELEQMPPGSVLHFRSAPIQVQTYEKGGYLNVSGVAPRASGSQPDKPLVPDHALSYQRAIRWARLVTNPKLNVVTFDVETTGLDFGMDEVISIGIVDCGGLVLTDTLIRPQNMANMSATNAVEAHGITADMVETAPTFPEMYGELKAFMHKRFWLGYNLNFDARMLDAACLRHGLEPLLSVGMYDACPVAADFIGQWDEAKAGYKYWKLAEAAERFGLVDFEAHHAAADALATWQIVKRMSEADAE